MVKTTGASSARVYVTLDNGRAITLSPHFLWLLSYRFFNPSTGKFRFGQMSQPEPRTLNPSAVTLFPELLEQIFEEVDTERRGYMLSHPIQNDYLLANNPCHDRDGQAVFGTDLECSTPKSRIPPLTRVCKRWKPVAERCLYRSIDIRLDDVDYFLTEGLGDRRFSRLLKTLKGNVVFANMVRELRAVTTSFHDPSDAEILAEIISACTQLSHLTVISPAYKGMPRKTFLKSLVCLSLLRSLVFVQCSNIRITKLDQLGLCSSDELLRRMDLWPNIEHVVVTTDARLAVGSQSLLLQRWLPYSYEFPHLRTFSVLQPTTSPSSLQALRAAAPQLQTLRVGLEAGVTGSPYHLCDALTAWQSTLSTLHLEHSEQFEVDFNLEDLLSHLSNLRSLYITTRLVPPKALRLAALEMLEYYIEDPVRTHVDALIDVLCHHSKLRTLTIAPFLLSSEAESSLSSPSSIPTENINRLNDACKDRSITFQSCFRDSGDTWSDSDGEDRGDYYWRDSYSEDSDSGFTDAEDWLDEYYEGTPCWD